MDQDYNGNQQNVPAGNEEPATPQPSALEPLPPESLQPSASLPVIPPKKKRWPAVVMAIVLMALLGGAGWWVWNMYGSQEDEASQAASNKKDIPLIRYALTSAIEPINQFYPAAPANEMTTEINQQIYDGLVRFEDETKVVPLLASKWTNEDEKTWMFELKQGVKFHTGNIMTADDVVYSYQEMLKRVEDSVAGQRAQLVTSTIETLAAVGTDKIKIVTKYPDILLLNRLVNLPILDRTAEGKVDPMYGSGAYQLKAGTSPTENELSLTAFDDYHGGRPYTRELHYTRYVPKEGEAPKDSELRAYEDMKAGKVDIIGYLYDLDTAEQIKTVKADGNYVMSIEDAGITYLALNSTDSKSPLSKLKVRQALYEALSIEEYTENVLADRDDVVTINQLVPKYIPGYNPDITRPARNIEHAKQLLNEAGYGNGFTLKVLTIEEANSQRIQELNRQFEPLNITFEGQPTSADDYLSYLQEGKSQVIPMAFTSSLLDAQDVLEALGSGGPLNNYQNSEVEQLLEQSRQTFDQEEHLQLLQQASKKMMDDVAIIPAYNYPFIWFTNKEYIMPVDRLGTGLGVYFYKAHLLE